MFATAAKYQIDGVLPGEVRYCGYVCNMDPVKDSQHVRDKLEIGDEPIIVVMAGGGADAFRLMETYLKALPLVDMRTATVMVTGPFMPEEQRKTLRDRARELGVQVRTSVSDSLSHLNAADLVVSMAGYNTVSEILRFRKRAILVPRPGPSLEQRMRARIFSERGLVTAIDPQDLSAPRLATAIMESLHNPTAPSEMPMMHGISTVKTTLLNWLGADQASARSWQDRHGSPARVNLAALR